MGLKLISNGKNRDQFFGLNPLLPTVHIKMNNVSIQLNTSPLPHSLVMIYFKISLSFSHSFFSMMYSTFRILCSMCTLYLDYVWQGCITKEQISHLIISIIRLSSVNVIERKIELLPRIYTTYQVHFALRMHCIKLWTLLQGLYVNWDNPKRKIFSE